MRREWHLFDDQWKRLNERPIYEFAAATEAATAKALKLNVRVVVASTDTPYNDQAPLTQWVAIQPLTGWSEHRTAEAT